MTEEDYSKDPEGLLPKFSFPSISVAFGAETLLQTLSTNLPTSKKAMYLTNSIWQCNYTKKWNFSPVLT